MDGDGFISFVCESCHTEIEASPDMIGETTECPACGAKLVVPDNRDDGIVRHASPAPAAGGAIKNRTIRIELDDL